MPSLAINGVRYSFECQGEGTPLILIHGFTGSASSWDHVAAALQHNHQVIAVDLLGHGRTDAPADPGRYAMAHAAADLAALMESLAVGPVHLLGYSMGGRLALYMALHYPTLWHSFILESASPGLADAAERQARRISDEALADRIEREGIPAFVGYWEKLPLFGTLAQLPAETQNHLRQQRLQNRPTGLVNSLRGMGTGAQASLWEQLPALQLPTLLMAGALDAKFAAIAQQMHQHMAASRLRIIPDAGHMIHLEQPSAFLRALQAFLDG